MFNDLSSLPKYLASRRSGKPREMTAPGPDTDTLDTILSLAMRTPDHGKLFPWAFVVIEDRTAFAKLIEHAFVAANPDARQGQIDAAVAPALMAPTLVILLHAPQVSAKIPAWEQELSTGAVAMNLLHSAHAHGFVASWITGWATYDAHIKAALCVGDERVAGLFFIGTPTHALEERPRPAFDTIVRRWPLS